MKEAFDNRDWFSPHHRAAAHEDRTGRTILVIELESQSDTPALVQIVEGAGYSVSSARESTAALRLLQEFHSGAVLVVSAHIGATLEAFCLRIREAAPAAPITVVGPRVGPHNKARVLEGGADDYIERPFDPHELLARLDSAFRRITRPRIRSNQRTSS